MNKFTKKELAEFRKLVEMAESRVQMDRINARLQQSAFIKKHGRDKCDRMFEVLQKEYKSGVRETNRALGLTS